jgi:acetolactate synthase-1/2/3 large subunit
MNTQELETIHRLKLPIKFFILNNNGYGSVRNTQVNLFEGKLVGCDDSSGVTLPDISKVAHAYGLHYMSIKNHSTRSMVRRVLNYPEAVICEVFINPEQKTEPRIMSHQVDGHIESDKLENMFPYLPESEQKENMKC